MKKSILIAGAVGMMVLISSFAAEGEKNDNVVDEVTADTETPTKPEYRLMDLPTVDLSKFAKDKDGWITLFDGKTFEGWRGYGRTDMPTRWTIEDGCIKMTGSGAGEAGAKDGGDIIFAHKFKNFELELEWKVDKGSNSGIFYMIQEVESPDEKGNWKTQPSYISAPEYQILDNENHLDARLGVDGNRQSASLYDMIPAKPQNSKPYGQWNKARIVSFKGTIVHFQNDVPVVEYHLWTPQWTEMLQKSKFSEEKWPLAFELLNNCGGENREGFFGLQDHGDTVWYRNIRIKVVE